MNMKTLSIVVLGFALEAIACFLCYIQLRYERVPMYATFYSIPFGFLFGPLLTVFGISASVGPFYFPVLLPNFLLNSLKWMVVAWGFRAGYSKLAVFLVVVLCLLLIVSVSTRNLFI